MDLGLFTWAAQPWWGVLAQRGVASCPELLDQARGPSSSGAKEGASGQFPKTRAAGWGGAWRPPSISGDTVQDAECSRYTPGPRGRRPAGQAVGVCLWNFGAARK